MKSFHSLSDDTLINISQYLTIKEMNHVSGLTSTLAKGRLGHSIFVHAFSTLKNAPFATMSSVPFIACTLLRRNHLTPYEFSVLYFGIKNRFVCNHVKHGILNTLQHSVMHLTHTCQKSALIESIITCFCSKITHLDCREDFCSSSPIAGLIDEHGHTPLHMQALYQYFKFFPNMQTLTLRSYHIQKKFDLESDLSELDSKKFFVGECIMNLIYSIYTDKHYNGLPVERDQYGQPTARIWRSFTRYHERYGCSGVVTFKYSYTSTTTPLHADVVDMVVGLSSYRRQADTVFNQFLHLKSELKTATATAFEDYVVSDLDLKCLKIFIRHVSKDVESCNRAVEEYKKAQDDFLP